MFCIVNFICILLLSYIWTLLVDLRSLWLPFMSISMMNFPAYTSGEPDMNWSNWQCFLWVPVNLIFQVEGFFCCTSEFSVHASIKYTCAFALLFYSFCLDRIKKKFPFFESFQFWKVFVSRKFPFIEIFFLESFYF